MFINTRTRTLITRITTIASTLGKVIASVEEKSSRLQGEWRKSNEDKQEMSLC